MVMFFEKTPGGIPINEEEGAILIGQGADIAKCVRVPEDLGSAVADVVDIFKAACPVTGKENCVHYKLEFFVKGKRLYVCESSEQFYWYTRKDNEQTIGK